MKPFDIAPYALPGCPSNELWFEQPRDIVRVVATFASAAPPAARLEYLCKKWPGERVERLADMDLVRPSQFGWMGMDDWFNCRWQEAAVVARPRGRRGLEFTFRGLLSEQKDFPDAASYDVTFRRTLGVRVAGEGAEARRLEAFTASAPVRTGIRVELDAGRRTPASRVRLSGYNAALVRLTPVRGVGIRGSELKLRAGPPSTGRDCWRAGKRRAFEAVLDHMAPAHRYCYDEGLVTFELDGETFTISLESLKAQGPVWFAEQGVYVALAGDATDFAAYRARTRGDATVAQQVARREEQSLGGAMNGQPRPHPIPFVFGCKHARQKFWLEPNGDLAMRRWLVTTQPAGDTPRWKNAQDARLFLGLQKWCVEGRCNDPWPVMAHNLRLRRGAIVLEQRAFAVPLATSILAGETAPDATMAALMRLRFRNTGEAPAPAELSLEYSGRADRTQNRRLLAARNATTHDGDLVPRCPRDELWVEGDRIESEVEGRRVVRCAFHTSMTVLAARRRACFTRMLAPGESCELVLKIPYVALEGDGELAMLRGLDFDRCDGELARYWRQEGGRGAQIHTPEPRLDAVYAGHLPMVLMADFGCPDGSGLVNTSVGAAVYGNFTNESCMILEELDQRGLTDEVRRRLGVWVKHQGTVKVTGNFTDFDGMYFGAGGLEQGHSYNQHHGWALWYLCRHYLRTGDRAWFATVADSVLAGADWIFRQRRNTIGPLPHSRGWEKGFLPAGSLEDVTDYFYWLSTNCLTWRGADAAAEALEAFGHPRAARVRREANAFARDLRQGFETARMHSPLVRLRDGRWVPHYPSRLYGRGRDFGWIREVLEGSVYLLLSGLYSPRGKQAKWILDDYLDTRYMNPPFGYCITDWRTEWFDCGGFSVQPNLLAGLLPHLDRDEIEAYLWMFFNAWAACYREEVGGLVEHPLPVLGFSNAAPFKTSDQSNAMKWLVYMFVYERKDLLHLGRAIPRAWLAGGGDGSTGSPSRAESRDIWARGVATDFGTVSIRYDSAGENTIVALVELDLRRRPARTLVRFRHPTKRPIASVTVNGRPHQAFDPAGDVDVSGMDGKPAINSSGLLAGKLEIVARYDAAGGTAGQ